MASNQNIPSAQEIKDSVVDGPAAQAVKDEANKTSSEFKDLADSRVIPEKPAATGQPLTQYHSMFYRLLSWKNPRATAITFATCIALIFASRYLNILRWTFKALYTVLGVTALAEVVGHATLGNGLASQMRPKKYYTIRKESLERFLDDVEQLINFGVIEFQRVFFAENIYVTIAAAASALLSYWLIHWLPLWGLALLSTSIAFVAPLIYLKNQERIDGQINQISNVINEQATQVRDLAAQHTNRATETVRSYAGEYTQKAQEMINGARGKATNGSAGNSVDSEEFPKAPTKTPTAPKTSAPESIAPEPQTAS